MWGPPRSHKFVCTLEKDEKKEEGNLNKAVLKAPSNLIFVGRGHLQPGGDSWNTGDTLDPDPYSIRDRGELKDMVAFTYPVSLRGYKELSRLDGGLVIWWCYWWVKAGLYK